MLNFHLTGEKPILEAVQDFTTVTGRTLGDEIIAIARLTAVELARRTQPFGADRAAQATGENRVKGDIGRVFATPPSIFSLLENLDPQESGYFWEAYRHRDFASMMEIMQHNSLRIESISDAPDPQVHSAARTRAGKVHKNYKPRQLVLREERLKTYIRKKQRMVGFAKAGWAKAADACGGHRGIPAWASGRHKNAAGGAIISRDIVRPTIRLINSTTYVSQILPEREQQAAIHSAMDRQLKRIQRMIQQVARSSPLGRAA